MSSRDTAAPPAGHAGRKTRLRDVPLPARAAMLVVEAIAVAWGIGAVATLHPSRDDALRLLLLVALCVVFEETSRQVGKLRLLIRSGPQPDMTSVWTFAAAITLPAGYLALFATFVGVWVWLRRLRSAGQYLHRRVYSGATVLLACLTADRVLSLVGNHLALPDGVRAATVVFVALIAYTSVNRLLITLAVALGAAPAGRGPIGTWEDNALELATLCLGALTALAVLHQPWLSVLVLLPMVLLQRGALVKQLEQAATTDAKTGLLNAVAWQHVAQRELSRARRESSAAAVLLIDLDHFKAVNDEHGHLAGDAALRAVGHGLQHALRDFDTVGRFGGEEFVAWLPNVGRAEAVAVAERIRVRIAELDVPGVGGRLSASIGLACFDDHGTDVEQLLYGADAALYAAKKAGRNRVMVAGDGQSTPVAQS